MIKALIFLFLLLFLVACSSSPEITSTTTLDSAPTDTLVLTSTVTNTITPTTTHTPTITSTPIPTYTPTPSCGDQNPGDLNDPGNPPDTNRYNALQPEISYDEAEYNVFQTELHNRIITVAIQKGFTLEDKFGNDKWQPEELVDYVYKTWSIYWREFGGFPFRFYTVVFGDGLPYEGGAFGEGFGLSNPCSAWIAHDIYHAWNGNAFRQQNNRSWYLEGVTVYYGDIRQSNNRFESMMRVFINYYLNRYEAGEDRVIGYMSMDDPDYDHLFVAQKGAVIAYLLDLELHKTGHHLGEVSRQLYQQYGIVSQGHPSNEQILAVINDVSGVDFLDFFNKYVNGIEKLPVSRNQEGCVSKML